MKHKEVYRFFMDDNVNTQVEVNIEHLFHRWPVPEIYLANIVTAFSSFFQLISTYSLPSQIVTVTAEWEEQRLSFCFHDIDEKVRKLFLQERQLREIRRDEPIEVYLIQLICDRIFLDKSFLVWEFDLYALPEDNAMNETKNEDIKNHSKTV
jgi:hypothetical protein